MELEIKKKGDDTHTDKEQDVVTDWDRDGDKYPDENTVKMKLTINASMNVN